MIVEPLPVQRLSPETLAITKPRRGRPHIPVVPTRVRVCLMDGAWVYRVSLQGKHGLGRWKTIDQQDWINTRAVLGEDWNIKPAAFKNGAATSYQITTCRRDALQASGREWPGNMIGLHRWITGATEWQSVLNLNGDHSDLRRCNLLLIDGGPVDSKFEEGGEQLSFPFASNSNHFHSRIAA